MLKFGIKFCALKDGKVGPLILFIISLLSQDLRTMREFLNIKYKQFNLKPLLLIIFLLKLLEVLQSFLNLKFHINYVFFHWLKKIMDQTVQ